MTLQFPLSSIPHRKSSRSCALLAEDLPEFPEEMVFVKGNLDVSFEKTDHFLKVEFDVEAELTLQCDRSLREFQQTTNGHYLILFKPDVPEETETEQSAIRQIRPGESVIDIAQEVRDTILLSLPLQRVHPDYIGEDGNIKEYKTESFGTFADVGNGTDPRWDALKKLSKQIKTDESEEDPGKDLGENPG